MHDSPTVSAAEVVWIDDNATNLLIAAEVCKGIGRIRAFETGNEALPSIFAKPPALIISDLQNRVMDGFELLDVVRKHPKTKHVPFFFCTASGMTEYRSRALSQGCDEFHTKPYEYAFMRYRISRILERATEYRNDSVASAALQPLRAFICYAKEDSRHAKKLWSTLSKLGVNAWLDTKTLAPGQDWGLEIRRAIKQSQLVFVCISQDSVAKVGFVQRELRYILDRADEQPPGAQFLIPVLIDTFELPERLERWQAVPLYGRGSKVLLAAAVKGRAFAVGAAVGIEHQ